MSERTPGRIRFKRFGADSVSNTVVWLFSVLASAFVLIYAVAINVATGFHFSSLTPVLRNTIVYPDALLVRAAYGEMHGGDPAHAREMFRRALLRDSASAFRWCDMGHILFRSGQREEAKYCFNRAVELGPYSPPVLIRAFTGLTALGLSYDALPLGARTLALTDRYDSELFELYAASTIPADEIWNRGIPADGRAAGAYLRYMLSTDASPANVDIGWNHIAAKSLADDKLANLFVDHLVAGRRYSRAAEVWKQQLGARAGSWPAPNRVVNGDFEFAPTGGMLDWMITDVPGVEVTRDTEVAHSGHASLRIHFDGSANVPWHHISQIVLMQPGRYRLQAWMRAEQLTTDEGVRFEIYGERDGGPLDVYTPKVSGSTDWKAVELVFEAPASMPLIRVMMIRQPSYKFDRNISGTLWIDGVTLTREGEQS